MHAIFRDRNITPDEIYAKPKRVRNFIYASFLLAIEERKEQEEEDRRERERKNRKKGGH